MNFQLKRTQALLSPTKPVRVAAMLLLLLALVGIRPQTTVSARTASANELTTYNYFVNVMGLNRAAACGLVANIQCESNFNPLREGDPKNNVNTSFGICQWHRDRKERLIKYCQKQGLNYKTIEAQLIYLEYELKTFYPSTYRYMTSVSNDATGAYNAAHYWCYYFEIPKHRAIESIYRGNLAKKAYWPYYTNLNPEPVTDVDPISYKVSYTRALKLTSTPYMSGNDVKYVQACLKKLGYNVTPDGSFGPNTASALKQFQSKYGLTADGICGSQTWNALEKAVGGTLNPKVKITTQPASVTTSLGKTVQFTVKASGDGLSYQWQFSDDGRKTWKNSEVKAAAYSTTLKTTNDGRFMRCIVNDKYGNSVTSSEVYMRTSYTFAITTQPASVTTALGKTVLFTVKAQGHGLSYQWQFSDDGRKTWKNSEVKAASYATTLKETNDGRYMRCIVTDQYGSSLTSSEVYMRTPYTFAITTQPVSVTTALGKTVLFTVKAKGDGLRYQWQFSDDGRKTWKNSTVQAASYATTLTETNDGRYMRCVVTDQYGSSLTSSEVYMKTSYAFAITTQPASVTTALGKTVLFTVKAKGDGLSYQWQISDDGGKTWRNSEVKAAAYATTLTEYNDGRYMRCVVTDQYGSHLTTKSVSMKAVYELLITTQPQTAVVMKGDTVYFNVKARGDGLGYQWQISDDGGKTWRDSAVKAAAYATTLTSANNGRHMRCVVSDKYGNKVTSKEAVMWMSGLRITSQPVDFSGKKGDTVRISVKAAGDGLSYQWQRSDEGGKTWKASTVKAADYVVTLSNAYNGRQVRCIVTDQYGNQITSNIASMKIA